ncbi:MAG TPA: choice-of-anchor P family protein, partial [Acidimicrobiales bacterium]|nr:choice-of-anchor P family protein [Acidimicrobiales bacterium]
SKQRSWRPAREPGAGKVATGARRRWRTRLMLGGGLALLASGGVGLATTLTAHADQSGPPNFGGYSLTATAPGFEATEDEPSAQAHPEGQGSVPETSTVLSSGPVGYALSSLAWPGSYGANGDQLVSLLFPGPAGQVVPVPDAVKGLVDGEAALIHYPVRAEARTGSNSDGSYNKLPGTTLTSHADGTRVEGIAEMKGVDLTGAATYGNLSSHSLSTLANGAGQTMATSTVQNVNLAGGAVKIASVTSTAQASSDGTKATTGGGTTVADMTIGGQRAYFDQTGVHAGSAGQPVNAAADQILNQALAGFGMKTFVSAPQSQANGATANYTAGSLVFTWTPPNNPSQNVFIVTLGGARVGVNATPSFESAATNDTGAGSAGTGAGATPPVGGDAGSPASADLGGSSPLAGAGPTTGSPTPAGTAGQAQPAGSVGTSPVAFFGGIGSLWIVVTLAGAALGGLGAKRLADDLLTRRTATTCPLDN